MKILPLVASVIALITAAPAAGYDNLTGKWRGTITANLKDLTGEGTPLRGATGTPVSITFSRTNEGLTGASLVGKSLETWEIHGDSYSWNDNEITVMATRIAYGDIPEWMRKEAELAASDAFHAFRYAGCTINRTKAPCEIGKQMPEGIENAVWLFKVDGSKMYSDVYYRYPSGGKRVIKWALNQAQ